MICLADSLLHKNFFCFPFYVNTEIINFTLFIIIIIFYLLLIIIKQKKYINTFKILI